MARWCRTLLACWVCWLTSSGWVTAEEPRTVKGLTTARSLAVGTAGRVFVTLMGERNVPGDGAVAVVDERGKVKLFAVGLDDPRGLVIVRDDIFVADGQKVWRVDARGKPHVHASPEAFPRRPTVLSEIATDGLGNLYLSDPGNRLGQKGAIFRVDPRRKVTQVLDGEISDPQILIPGPILLDDPDHIFVVDAGFGYLYRYDLITGTPQRVASTIGGGEGLTRDNFGRLFVCDASNSRLFVIGSILEPTRILDSRFATPGPIAFSNDGRHLLALDTRLGTLTYYPTRNLD